MADNTEVSTPRYRIHEAAALLNLKPYVLRFWEVEFPQLIPDRNGKKQRLYTAANMKLLRRIRQLLHERGMSNEETQRALEGEVPAALERTVPETRRVDFPQVGIGNTAIKVVGIGDTGTQAVRKLHSFPLLCEAVAFVCAHKNESALDETSAPEKILLRGKPEDDFAPEAWHDVLAGLDMVIVVTGLGEHAENGVIPLVARTAKELGVLVACLVAMPVTPENSIDAKRDTLDALCRNVDCLMPISVRFPQKACRQMSFENIQGETISAVCNAVRSIVMLFAKDGLISIDFADVQYVLSQSGMGGAGLGIASGKSRAQKAARRALDSLPFDMPLKSVKRAMYNITAPDDVASEEIQEVCGIIAENLSADCFSIFGLQLGNEIERVMQVSIVVSTADWKMQ